MMAADIRIVLNGQGWAEALVLAVVAVVALVLTIVYFVPERMSGPLLANESRARSLTHVAPLLALLAATCALVVLAVDIRKAEPVALVSRLRQSAPDCRNVTWAPDDQPASVCDERVRDLGELVDRVLESVDPDEARSQPRSEILATLADAAAEELAANESEELVPLSSIHARPSEHPPWVINTVELAIMRALVDERRVTTSYVAPPGFRTESLWQSAAEVLSERGAPMVLVDEAEIPSDLHVRRLRDASYEPDGAAWVWAVIAGRIAAGAKVELAVVQDGILLETVTVPLQLDGAPQRLTRLRFQCTTCATGGGEFRLVAKHEVGAATPLLPASERQFLRLALDGGVSEEVRGAVGQILSPHFAASHVGALSELELNALRLPLPTPAVLGEARSVTVSSVGSSMLFARDQAARAAALEWYGALPRDSEASNGHVRFAANGIGPSTAWSHEGVGDYFVLRGGIPSRESDLVARVSRIGELEREQKLGAVYLGKGWAIAEIPVPTGRERTASLHSVPFVRAVAWLASYALLDSGVWNDGSNSEVQSVGLLTQSGLARRLQRSRLEWRFRVFLAIAIAMFGLMLLRLGRGRREIENEVR